MAALAETAQQDPSLIENMITANGNGTYSVALHTDDGVDYVTVNSQLPTYLDDVTQFDGSGMEFSNSTNSLWAPLIEKAAAQLSEQGVTTGLDFTPGQNQYYELTGGLGEGISLVTGQSYETYNLADDNVTTLENVLGTLQNSLAAGDDVILGTNELTGAAEIVADHAYAVLGVDPASGMIDIYNPWGADAPGGGVHNYVRVSATLLVSDQAEFFVGVGARAAA
jgi:hypothetical protein